MTLSEVLLLLTFVSSVAYGVFDITWKISHDDKRYKNKKGENIDQTEWHNIVLWRGLAEIVEKYVKKGMRLYIEGRIRTRSWDDQNGVKRYTTEIYADNMQMLSSRQDGEATGNAPRSYTPSVSSSTSTTATPPMNTPDDNDDLPF